MPPYRCTKLHPSTSHLQKKTPVTYQCLVKGFMQFQTAISKYILMLYQAQMLLRHFYAIFTSRSVNLILLRLFPILIKKVDEALFHKALQGFVDICSDT